MASREEIVRNFDPSGVGLENGNFCGLPFDYDTAGIILLGVPWEVTVSYHDGTAAGPSAILEASPQLDLYDLDNSDGWQQGIFMPPIPDWMLPKNNELRPLAASIVRATEQGINIATDAELSATLATINTACEGVNHWLYDQANRAIALGKRVGAIGGDHSIPLGLLRSLAEHHPNFGILHIDAHADLRDAYQGFQYSHASIMSNVLALPQVSRLVQVGIRDISHSEVAKIRQSPDRIWVHYDAVLKEKQYSGVPWLDLCRQIIAPLPRQVYVSFDVDGLDPKLCPSTGTPVPGGLELEEAFCLLRELVRSDCQIIGFDVSEVGGSEWDGNVGARIVYKLCNLMGL
ncbi:agmatinase family protein [Oscillatoria sp. CS-180]|uniref:agmatinase family protein n=1 Tax=Oscillatoria sp. CS-180 TaxID=3021720 RepID=UPI0023307E36|nr:agmatinase family protein [Oscillatoria sp. CS-180]MDB9528591.1 agmatinase family protein [Oscillatoria sp. CS-180]